MLAANTAPARLAPKPLLSSASLGVLISGTWMGARRKRSTHSGLGCALAAGRSLRVGPTLVKWDAPGAGVGPLEARCTLAVGGAARKRGAAPAGRRAPLRPGLCRGRTSACPPLGGGREQRSPGKWKRAVALLSPPPTRGTPAPWPRHRVGR